MGGIFWGKTVRAKIEIDPQVFPLTNWQKLMISTIGDPKCSDSYKDRHILRWAHLVSPKGDQRRISRAFDKLVKRHDVLRLRFGQDHKGEWRAEIHPTHPTGLVTEEIGDVSDAEFDRIINSKASADMPIASDSLVELKLLRCGARGDVLLWRVHHAIVDGYSVMVLLEEFIAFLLNIPVLKKAVSHAQYIEHVKHTLTKHEPKNTEFWNAEILPLLPAPEIGRVKNGNPIIPTYMEEGTISHLIGFNADEIHQLEGRVKKNGLTLFSYLYTAFGDALLELSGAKEIYICSVVGRTDAKLQTYLGPHISLVTYKYAHSPELSTAQKALHVSDKLTQGYDYLPTAAFLPDGEIGDAFQNAKRERLQFFAHIPDSSGRAKNSMFSKAFSTGAEQEISLGFVKLRKLTLDAAAHTNAELQFSLHQTGDKTQVSLAALASSFSIDDLEAFAIKMKMKLSEPSF